MPLEKQKTVPPSTPAGSHFRFARIGTVLSKPPGMFYDVCRVLGLGVFGMTMRVKSKGLRSVDHEGGMLVAVSHVSHLDPIVVSAMLGRRISWVSRIEFYQHWFMRTLLYHGGAFQVNRTGAARPMIREGLRRLKRGEAVGIFPEGELMRGKNSVLRGASIKQGVCMLAALSGRPVLPVIVLGTEQLIRIGPWLPAKRGKLWILAGNPIHAVPNSRGRRSRDEFAQRLIAEYTRLYAEIRLEFNLPEDIAP
ncbi:MAG: lysophospholipid acyltransferase family protein [Luteolibacter sp.]|uniref:lysophospholipid acyltransferase family protein n=1 Tax=Luteolibacter sp. TaxID=1962973 RepID=UPI003266DC7E